MVPTQALSHSTRPTAKVKTKAALRIEDDMPKSAARILNAEKVQKEWRERKRKGREDEEASSEKKRRKTGEKGDGDKVEWSKHLKVCLRIIQYAGVTDHLNLQIKPGEHIRHFNQ